MHKLLSILMVLALILAPLSALAAQGDANLGRNFYETYRDNISGIFTVNDTLYVYGYKGIYAWQVGDADLAPIAFPEQENSGDTYSSIQSIFADGETIYALIATYLSSDTTYSLERVELIPLEIEGDAVSYGDATELSRDDLVVNYGDENDYMIQINSVCCADGRAYLCVYNDMGESAVYMLNLSDGSGMFLEDLVNPLACTPYEDGHVLIQCFDWNAKQCNLLDFDPEAESLSPACPPLERENTLQGIVYSAETGRLFFQEDGYVKAATDFDFENAVTVAEYPQFYYNDQAAHLLPGDYYVCFDYESISVRATDPESLPQTRIVVSGMSDYVTDAYYDFTNTHGDVAVVLSQDYQESSAIIEGMMNRDSTNDILLLSVNSKAFDSLYQRGYLAEIDDAELKAAIGGMYPGLQEVLLRDGEVVAVPVRLYGWIPGISVAGFEKIGVSREEIPTNWLDFLDFLETLSDKLPEDGSVRIFDEYMTQEYAKNELFSAVFQSYKNAMPEGEIRYNTPELQAAFEKLLNLDYEAMGLPEDDDEAEMMGGSVSFYSVGDYERTYTLFTGSVGCTLGNFYNDFEPWPLSFSADDVGVLPIDLTVAVINPFSEHRELAQEFLRAIYDTLSEDTLYNLSDALNEPRRYDLYEENLAEVNKMLEDERAAMEKAEPVDKPAHQETIDQLEKTLEDMEANYWMISPESLEWYRSHAQNLHVMRYDYTDEADGLYDQAEQLLQGRLSPADFLSAMDQKIRMMALEGN